MVQSMCGTHSDVEKLEDECTTLNIDTSNNDKDDTFESESAPRSNHRGNICCILFIVLVVIVFGGGAGIFYSIGYAERCDMDHTDTIVNTTTCYTFNNTLSCSNTNPYLYIIGEAFNITCLSTGETRLVVENYTTECFDVCIEPLIGNVFIKHYYVKSVSYNIGAQITAHTLIGIGGFIILLTGGLLCLATFCHRS